jgi:hypothetical protein
MSTTSELIDALVEGATPVKTLRPPLTRACAWLVLALVIVALLAAVHGLRPDLGARLQQWEFLSSSAAALATGALAALAAFMVSLPDRSDGWLWLPVPALAAWVSTIGYGCFADWVSMGPDGAQWGETARCFATVLLTSVPLGLALAVMVRHAALLRARAVAAAGGLAVAALTAAALSLLHPIEATAMILIWNAGIVALVAGLATVFGRAVLRWTALRFAPDPHPT